VPFYLGSEDVIEHHRNIEKIIMCQPCHGTFNPLIGGSDDNIYQC
jgi:hypothetical protein